MSADKTKTVCRGCGGRETFEERTVSRPLQFDGRVVIFENVPALVCHQCGEMLLGPDTVKLMEDLGRGERPPTRIAQIPVYDLAD